MKLFTIGALVAAQLAATAAPAAAAELINDQGGSQRGAFAGARLRVPLQAEGGKVRLGLGVAGIERSRATGENRLSQGVELGFAGGKDIELAIGGRSLKELEAERKARLSPFGWVAIGVAVVAVAYVAWAVNEMNEPHD
jgi:opacity protein-like surface antigen